MTFETAWASRIEVDVGALRLSVIGRDALVANKRAAARPKDLNDLLLLGVKPKPRAKKRASRRTP